MLTYFLIIAYVIEINNLFKIIVKIHFFVFNFSNIEFKIIVTVIFDTFFCI